MEKMVSKITICLDLWCLFCSTTQIDSKVVVSKLRSFVCKVCLLSCIIKTNYTQAVEVCCSELVSSRFAKWDTTKLALLLLLLFWVSKANLDQKEDNLKKACGAGRELFLLLLAEHISVFKYFQVFLFVVAILSTYSLVLLLMLE